MQHFYILKQYSGICLKMVKSHCKILRWNNIENENRQTYLGNIKQNAMLPVFSPLDTRFGFVRPFFFVSFFRARLTRK